MNGGLRYAAVVVLLVVALGIGVVGGALLDRHVLLTLAPPSGIPSDAQPEFQLIAEAWNLIEQVYVDRSVVTPQNLGYGAITGMTDALGDTGHSRFLTPQMVKEEQQFTQGQFVGVGIEIEAQDAHIVIVAPIDNSPAQAAGLKAGEIILKVNGQDVSGMSVSQVQALVAGPAGTSVTLTIQDPSTDTTFTVTLVRAVINVQNVTWVQVPGTQIADVRIAGFSEGVTSDLRNALQQILQQGSTGLILDLRDNPGGLLDQAVGTASQFLTTGNVLLEKNAKGDITPVPVESGAIAPDIPMVVLVNAGTASAAEIVAGALKDPGRATLVGETTFGTGTVLNQFSLSDGSALLLATQEWLTPDGHTIWHVGLDPNVVMALPANVAPLYPSAERSLTAAQVQSSGDAQLLRGLQILQTGAQSPGSGVGFFVTLPSSVDVCGENCPWTD
jgi:carboxyl-terminal processing protease